MTTLKKGRKLNRRIVATLALMLSLIFVLVSIFYISWAFIGFATIEVEACALIDCARDAQYGWSATMVHDMKILDGLERKFGIAMLFPGIPMMFISALLFRFWDDPKTTEWVKRMCK